MKVPVCEQRQFVCCFLARVFLHACSQEHNGRRSQSSPRGSWSQRGSQFIGTLAGHGSALQSTPCLKQSCSQKVLLSAPRLPNWCLLCHGLALTLRLPSGAQKVRHAVPEPPR